MKKTKATIFSSLLLTLPILANASFDIQKNIQKLDWNGIEVTYLEDSRFPTFDLAIYFADGAISDLDSKVGGETQSAFSMTMLGTKKYSREVLSEKFEFFGADSDVNVTHEYSTISLSGLAKDILPLTKLTCEILTEATFPTSEIQKVVNVQKSQSRALENNHGALAGRIFREVSLEGTPFSYPTSGKLSDLDKIQSEKLKAKMDYFLTKVKKRIYITGPKSVLSIKDVINKECGFTGETSQFVRTPTYKKKEQNDRTIVFAPVEKANQVQVMLGSFLNKDELKEDELNYLASEFLGGGFTSKLMQEIRVKRGLTYSVGAIISSQKTYGRAVISTFTKNETILELINVLTKAIDTSAGKNHKINPKQLGLVKQGVVGSYPFKFENNGQFLGELMMMDHSGQSYDDIFKFQERVSKFNELDVARVIENVFGRKRQTIFVLGDKSLLTKLKKLGPVRVVNFKDYI